jgi:hypothetical protein
MESLTAETPRVCAEPCAPEVAAAPVSPPWHEAAWPCGHNDPVYINAYTQQCAVCSATRTECRYCWVENYEVNEAGRCLACDGTGIHPADDDPDAGADDADDEPIAIGQSTDEPRTFALSPSACRPLSPFPHKDKLVHEIPLNVATAAHAGSSFVPERRGEQERESYAAQMVADYEALAKYATTDEKRATLDEEFARYKTGYRAKFLAYLGANARCLSPMITGPSNFPTARNRKRLDTAHKRLEELEGFRGRALDAIRKTLRPELRPVMAGDDDAVERLKTKIAQHQNLQKLMVDSNAAIRQHKSAGPEAQIAALVALGHKQATAEDLLKPDFCGRIGFASYQLSNNGNNIRRMETRLAEISKAKVAEVTEAQGEHAKLEDNPGDNRVRLFFPGKPSDVTRARLKSAGFRWTPSMGCWQAYRNHNTIATARREAGVAQEG